MLWVHVPYTRHKNDLVKIEDEILVNMVMTMLIILILMKVRKFIILFMQKGEKKQYAVFDE